MMNLLFPIVAFLLVVGLTPLLRWAAPRIGLMDAPDDRKRHEGQIPLIGGLVILPVFMAVLLLCGFNMHGYWPLYLAILIVLGTGALDDFRHMHPWLKFALQGLASVIVVVFGGAQLHSLGDLFGLGGFELGFMALPFSLAAVMLLINAVNLMDGLDGLAGGSVLIMLGFVAYGYVAGGDMGGALPIIVLMAAIAGFLVYNFRHPWRARACVFLGDAGSLSLGLCLAWFAIDAGKGADGSAVLPSISIAWILALPIMDTCAQFYRRVREGRHPFSPDRGHFHHHFVHAGLSDRAAVLCVYAVIIVMGAFGVFAPMMGVPMVVVTGLWIVTILAHMTVSRHPDIYVRAFERLTSFGQKSKE